MFSAKAHGPNQSARSNKYLFYCSVFVIQCDCLPSFITDTIIIGDHFDHQTQKLMTTLKASTHSVRLTVVERLKMTSKTKCAKL